ncbi:MAG TPA: MarR family transcriptional regulator [Streptosporangiaceae bacterium]|nr:MarR family transcriptional regulator [Streptosporangiaceae bacterium]
MDMTQMAAPGGTVRTADVERLSSSLERLVSVWRRVAVPGELSATSVFTLGRLLRDGPYRLTDLAAHEHVSQPAMTQLVSRLEAQRLAERVSDPRDARVVNVQITAAGEALVNERRKARAARFAELFAALPEADKAVLASALPALEMLADLGAQQ